MSQRPSGSETSESSTLSRGGHHLQGGVPLGLVTYVSALVAALATVTATLQGPGLTADSLSYFSSGLNWADGLGLQTFSGMKLTMFPPLLSAMIGIGHQVGLSPELSMRAINCVAAAGIVVVGSSLARRYVSSQTTLGLTSIVLAVNVALLDLSKMALSECLFVLISLVFLASAEALVIRPSFYLAGCLVLSSWMGFGLRYAGVVLLPVGAWTILMAFRHRGWRFAITAGVSFGGVAAVGPLLVMVRNHGVDGTLMGPRTPSTDGLLGTVARFVAITGKWVLPDPIPTAVQALSGLVLFAVLGGLVVRLVRRSDDHRSQLLGLLTAPTVVFTLTYSAYIIIAQTMVAFDKLNSRLMSPIIVPAIVLAAGVIERTIATLPAVQRLNARRAAASALSVLLLIQLTLFGLDVFRSGRDGVDYGSREWQSSETLRAAKDLPKSATIYSNTPAGTWAVVRRQPILISPLKEGRRTGEPVPMSEEFLTDVRCKDVYLVWMNSSTSNYLLTPEELTQYVDVERTAVAGDGAIYRLSPIEADASTGC